MPAESQAGAITLSKMRDGSDSPHSLSVSFDDVAEAELSPSRLGGSGLTRNGEHHVANESLEGLVLDKLLVDLRIVLQ